MFKLNIMLFLIMSFFTVTGLSALDVADGRIRFNIDERTGRLTLYYMTDVDTKKYEPLFWDRDKKTSMISVSSNGTEYRLGDASQFKMYVRGTKNKPILAFESKFLSVTEEFSFIRTASSGVTNGIRIDIKVENWGDKKQEVGVRLLLDTFLGEKGDPNFRTNARPISSETRIDSTTQDKWWVSENGVYGLMGSIFVDGIDSPDYLHFANWKRLFNAKFTTEYIPSRNFNDPPFSIRDSAVCYYMDIRPLERWNSRGFTVLLAALDQYGFDVKKDTGIINTLREEIFEEQKEAKEAKEMAALQQQEGLGQQQGTPSPSTSQPITPSITIPSSPGLPGTAGSATSHGSSTTLIMPQSPAQNMENNVPRKGGRNELLLPIGPMRLDLSTLRAIIYKVDEHIYFSSPVSEEELRGMEAEIGKLRSKYGGIFGSY